MIDEKEIKALITLLDDPDENINNHVVSKLLSFGPAIVPTLESAWEEAFDPILQQDIENIIHKINFDALKKELQEWKEGDRENLLDAILIVCKYQYPDLDIAKVKSKIEEIRRSIWLEISHNFTPLEQVNIFNHIFYTLYGFKGNTKNIQDPQYYYINTLLDTKKGNPVSLGILYLLVAQQLELPIYGVNLPQHFILAHTKYIKEEYPQDKDVRNNILFYINTFNKGLIFTKNEIDLFLKKLKVEPKPEYYLPCNNARVVCILIKGLIYTFRSIGSKEKVGELESLLEIVNE